MRQEKHPKGLPVLFFTEMWERFGFYSMLAMFVLYLRSPDQGLGWTPEEATRLYSWYLMFVYFSPLAGGLIADLGLGFRNSVLIGGVIFMVGYATLSVRSVEMVYLALVLLVIGNGFFKPNVSAMVGHLYREGSPLKDRAFNIFYMGINIGAFLAPLSAEFVAHRYGFNNAFLVAAGGMVVSVAILWIFRQYVEPPPRPVIPELPEEPAPAPATGIQDVAPRERIATAPEDAEEAAVTTDAPPPSLEPPTAPPRSLAIDTVPDWMRVGALLVIFAIVIVFWMVFHQNGSTLTYWADDNTDWNVSGIISNAINPFWVVTLTFPLVWVWGWLNQRGLEPSTPSKIAIGMFLTAITFGLLYLAAKSGEAQKDTATPADYAKADFRLNERALNHLEAAGVPADVLAKLNQKGADGKYIVRDKKFATDEKSTGEQKLTAALGQVLTAEQLARNKDKILQQAYLFKVSPFWLVLAYAIVTLGELMLSPMGLSLVSKVAPMKIRGLMMGGWFAATAIGNKLTAIGVYWDVWLQSTFFAVLGGMALGMAFVLLFLLRPLKKAMPGV
jgi:POT family proton-dependent oligopeptide transporter